MQKASVCVKCNLSEALGALAHANWGPAGNRAVYGLMQVIKPIQDEWNSVVKKILDAHKDGEGLKPEGVIEYNTMCNTMGNEEFEIEKIKLMRGTAFDNLSYADMSILECMVEWQGDPKPAAKE